MAALSALALACTLKPSPADSSSVHTDDYADQDTTPEKTAETTRTAARNAVHLAAQLKAATYPA